jgi:hypothetical protein
LTVGNVCDEQNKKLNIAVQSSKIDQSLVSNRQYLDCNFTLFVARKMTIWQHKDRVCEIFDIWLYVRYTALLTTLDLVPGTVAVSKNNEELRAAAASCLLIKRDKDLGRE